MKKLQEDLKRKSSISKENGLLGYDECCGFSEKFIFEFFRSISLVNLQINFVDEKVKRFINIEELSLTGIYFRLYNFFLNCIKGNLLKEINSDFLPKKLQLLHLNTNK